MQFRDYAREMSTRVRLYSRERRVVFRWLVVVWAALEFLHYFETVITFYAGIYRLPKTRSRLEMRKSGIPGSDKDVFTLA